MSRDTFVSSSAPRALEEHARILPTLVGMSRSVRWLDPADPDPLVFDRVLTQVRELRSQLESHFDAEDRSRLHARLVALVPDADKTINRLGHEHRTTLRDLDDATSRALRCSPLHVERLRADLESVLAVLFDHEAVEDQLMARAFQVEVGAAS